MPTTWRSSLRSSSPSAPSPCSTWRCPIRTLPSWRHACAPRCTISTPQTTSVRTRTTPSGAQSMKRASKRRGSPPTLTIPISGTTSKSMRTRASARSSVRASIRASRRCSAPMHRSTTSTRSRPSIFWTATAATTAMRSRPTSTRRSTCARCRRTARISKTASGWRPSLWRSSASTTSTKWASRICTCCTTRNWKASPRISRASGASASS